uniref:Uncharacterized protein n=1 Tax=Callorhinchus milii TaxID=7868 RepID=A0A4W3GYN3_CALMI
CRTPLHYAAVNGSYQCTVTLVTAGAGTNGADERGCTPVHYAAAAEVYSRSSTSTNSHQQDEEMLRASREKEAFLLVSFISVWGRSGGLVVGSGWCRSVGRRVRTG